MKDKMSARQAEALAFCALLALAVSLPGRVAEEAGGLGWLSPAVAFPAAVAMGWLLGRLGPLAGGLREALGRGLGSLLLAGYVLWGLFLYTLYIKGAVGRLALAGDRALAGPWLAVALTAVMGWIVWGKAAALGRMAQIFRGALAVGLGAIILLGLGHVDWANLTDGGGAVGVVSGARPVVSLLTVGVFAAFLWGGEEARPRWTGKAALFCGGLALLLLVIVGRLGAELTVALPLPFFTVTQGLGVEGAFQRFEGLTAALWLLADVALLALLAHGARAVMAELWGEPAGRWGGMGFVVLGLGGYFLVTDQWADRVHGVVAAGNFLAALVVPGLALLVRRVRDRRR